MRWATFKREFRPQANPMSSPSSMDGLMFETFGEEYEFVKRTFANDPLRVWTVLDPMTRSGAWYVVEGLHFVNRVGYLITEKPAQQDVAYEVPY